MSEENKQAASDADTQHKGIPYDPYRVDRDRDGSDPEFVGKPEKDLGLTLDPVDKAIGNAVYDIQRTITDGVMVDADELERRKEGIAAPIEPAKKFEN